MPPGVVGVAHSRAPRVGENRGIMRNSTISSDHGPAPMCADPLTAHGNPTTTQHTHRKIPSFQQKPAPHPAEAPPSHVQHQRQPHPKHAPTTPHTEIGPIQPDQPNVETRTTSSGAKTTCPTSGTIDEQQTRGSTTDLDAKLNRSRHGLRPISTRVSTDLVAEPDRSRHGLRPISWRNRTDLGEGVVRG